MLTKGNEMVGLAAAEALSQPMMQLTLNSFHFSGSSHEMTSSFSRLKRLLQGNRKLPVEYQFPEALPEVIPAQKLADLIVSIDFPTVVLRFPDRGSSSIVEALGQLIFFLRNDLEASEIKVTLKDRTIQAEKLNRMKLICSLRKIAVGNAAVLKVDKERKKITCDRPSLSLFPEEQRHLIVSSDFREVTSYFGIEVGRAVFFTQLKEILSETGVLDRHLNLVADYVFWTGDLTFPNYHGMTRHATTCIHRASVHHTFQEICKAVSSGKKERISDLAHFVMLGGVPNSGPFRK
ncbi:hypothetical protein GpartN1_g1930.t1 [Galdieria partita]|uniref:DNA-directed RNA polymerase n=1 Tax=Galdieria partita TaxID=83374 RepID=A0A9C7PTH5_9RHOD|nr:hypothetical protein GpartN1_g1930.t1 [Galdieria partita]